MRALIIGKEGSLSRRIKQLEAAGYAAVEVPGAVHLGRGVWIFPVEVRVCDSADQTATGPGGPKETTGK